jgi:hypothetical protein
MSVWVAVGRGGKVVENKISKCESKMMLSIEVFRNQTIERVPNKGELEKLLKSGAGNVTT